MVDAAVGALVQGNVRVAAVFKCYCVLELLCGKVFIFKKSQGFEI